MTRNLAALLALLCQAIVSWAGIDLRDDTGRVLHLDRPAQRIITLAPHATELLFAAGAGATLIATVEFSDFPPAARRLPRVGGYETIDVERIVALKPDLVVAWGSGNPPAVIDLLIALRVPVYISEPRKLDDIATSLIAFGRFAASVPAAEKAAVEFRQRAAALRTRYGSRSPVRVFYQVWDEPLMTVNDSHLISKVLDLCGGRNVFGGLPSLAPTVDVEAVLAADPDAILSSEETGARRNAIDSWRRWPRLRAVRNEHLLLLPPDILVRHSPRILDGAQAVCDRLDRVRDRIGASRQTEIRPR